jgi:hypothetical protein
MILSLLWKIPVVVVAIVVGIFGASQAGWCGAELFVNSILRRILEQWVTMIMLAISLAITTASVLLVYRIAKHALWVMAPILLYVALVPGIWNGLMSDFDARRAEVLRVGYANAYALEHMKPRGRYRTCEDQGISLSDDGKALCVSALKVGPGEIIPGGENRCGLLGMFACVNTTPEK